MRYSIAVAGGLGFAPLAWAISTAIGQVMPYMDCRMGRQCSMMATALLSLLAALGALTPLTARGKPQTKTAEFIRMISILAGSAFAFALTMQAAATLLVNPCQH